MTEDLLEEVPVGKLHKINTIRIVSFFGGILAGGFLIAENFRSMGDQRKEKRTIIFSVIAAIASFALIFLPFLDKIPNIVFPLIYSFIIGAIADKLQGRQIASHIEKGGSVFGVGRVILVAFVGFVINLAIFVALLYFTGMLPDFN